MAHPPIQFFHDALALNVEKDLSTQGQVTDQSTQHANLINFVNFCKVSNDWGCSLGRGNTPKQLCQAYQHP